MPRAVAPPPSGEFTVKLTKPWSGHPTHTIEVIGEPNRSATVKTIHYSGNSSSNEKTGEMPKDDVNELMRLITELRGFPSSPSKDIYEADARVDFNTFDIQWSNEDEDPEADTIKEIAFEQKDDFKRIVDSIEALGRQFAKKNSAI